MKMEQRILPLIVILAIGVIGFLRTRNVIRNEGLDIKQSFIVWGVVIGLVYEIVFWTIYFGSLGSK